jgi:WD40 repeat protein
MATRDTVADPLQFARTISLADGPANAIAISPDGSTAAAGFDNGTVRFWRISTGESTGTPLKASGAVNALAFAPGGQHIAVVAGSTNLWALASAKPLPPLPSVPQPTIAIAFAGAQTLISGHADGAVRWWNTTTVAEVGTVNTGLGEAVGLEVSGDGQRLAVANLDTTITLWSAADRTLQTRLTDLVLAPYSLDFSPDGRLLAVSGADGIVRCWDTATWKATRTLAGQPDPVWGLVFVSGNRLVAAGTNAFNPSLPSHLRVWDVAGQQLVQDILLPAGVSGMAATPDRKTIVFAGADPTIRVWNVAG